MEEKKKIIEMETPTIPKGLDIPLLDDSDSINITTPESDHPFRMSGGVKKLKKVT